MNSTPVGSLIDRGRMIKRLHREFDAGYHGEKLRQIELVRVGEDRKFEHICDWMKDGNWPEPKDLAAEMDEKVSEAMQGSTEPFVTFKFRFYHGSSRVSRNGDITEKIENTDYHDPEFAEMVPLENPSAKGLARMHVVALHDYMKLTIGERTENMRMMRDMMRDMASELAEMRKERKDNWRVTQDLLDRTQERQLALAAAKRMEAVKEQVWGMIATFAPSAAAGFIGWLQKQTGGTSDGAPPAGIPSREALLVRSFILSMDPRERQGFMMGLTKAMGESRAMPMLELMNGMQEELALHDQKRILAPGEDPPKPETPEKPAGE